MKVYAVLYGFDGNELDRVLVNPNDPEADSAELSEMIKDALDTWELSGGDTIKIIEVA